MENQEIIPLENHLCFVKSLSKNDKKIYWAVYSFDEFIGSVNIEFIDNSSVERGIYVNPEYLGQSKGTLIELALDKLLIQFHINRVEAKVLLTNERSLKFHQKTGYQLTSVDNKYYYLEKHLDT